MRREREREREGEKDQLRRIESYPVSLRFPTAFLWRGQTARYITVHVAVCEAHREGDGKEEKKRVN